MLPKEFTSSLRKVTGEFLWGVWKGMGTVPKKRTIRGPKRRIRKK